MGCDNPKMQQEHWALTCWKAAPQASPGVPLDTHTNRGQQCTPRLDSDVLGCIWRVVPGGGGRKSFPSAQHWQQHTWNAASSSGPPLHRHTGESNQGSAAQITGGKADSTGNIQPTEEKIQGESHQWAQIPEKHMLKYRVRLPSAVPCDRTRGDGHRLKH